MATQPIYQFYSCLKDYQPVIWRRFQVAGNVSLARLGYILMTMYEMQASHLFCIDYFLKEDLLDYLREKNLPTEDMRWNRPEVIHYEVLTEESLPDTETERTMDATAMTLRRFPTHQGFGCVCSMIMAMAGRLNCGWNRYSKMTPCQGNCSLVF